MLFEDLASAIYAAQTEPNNESILSELFKTNSIDAHDIITVCCAKPQTSIKEHHVIKMLAESYGLFPEEYKSLMDEQEMPALLATESPQEVNQSLKVREVIEMKDMIIKGELNADILFNSMSGLAAMLFWGYAFGRTSINYRRIMRAIASITKYDTRHLQKMRSIMPAGEIIQRALNETLQDEYTIQPTYPFKAPRYSRWNKWSVPFKNTHYHIIRGKHYYAHVRGGSVYCYDSDAKRVARNPILSLPYDSVCEVDEDGNIVEYLHTVARPELWKQVRSSRLPVQDGAKIVKDRAHLRAIVQSLEHGEVLRLMDGDRPYFHSGASGGFVVPRRTFDIPLIILGGFREGEGIRIKIAALDGFDAFPVGYAYVKEDDIPDKLMRLYHAQGMMDIDEGLIGVFHSLGYEHEEKKMRAPYLTRIDTTLGHSDAIQIGDLIERGE
tara:strand:- start:48728 stop:50047 length:1320 start_codon:yes stop_codon:yes gene_type:complete